ncbi:transcriptional regulator [Gorillibacterium sp. sgz5001074]|uniref:transcriptional regulator n=1 Tax=Gorillibacterium sp. sgz5001074 TaxID=3446695 RepID=UPI003F674F05
MGLSFEEAYEHWMEQQKKEERNPRRRELLNKGLSYGTVAFLRSVWFPAIGNLDHLLAEYEVRDMNNRYRYLDLAYMPGSAKGCIEIQDYSSHARDIDTGRFKDLCLKQAMLALDDWHFLPVAFLSIREDPGVCKQMILAFVGKFLSVDTGSSCLNWAEAEALRYARRMVRPIEPKELAAHLMLSDNRTRVLLRSLVSRKLLTVASGSQRYRTYRLGTDLQ